jgi:RNA polymerase sigma factor (sigma-70 family)
VNEDRDALASRGVSVAALFARHEAEVGRFLVQFCGDRELAADLLQDTFLAVIASEHSLGRVENLRAFIYGIARLKALQSRRAWRRMMRACERLASRPVSTAPEPLDVIYVRDLLARTLTPDDRALVLLSELHGFTSAELAASSGLTAPAVRKRLSRARARLRQAESCSRTPLTLGIRNAKETP